MELHDPIILLHNEYQSTDVSSSHGNPLQFHFKRPPINKLILLNQWINAVKKKAD